MKISVIIAAYNAEKWIADAIDDLRGQTHKDLEMILVDDGSTDKTADICRQKAESDDRIRVISQKNGGPSCARNRGLSAATGEYIGFMDADDRVDPEMYRLLAQTAKRYKSDIAACNFEQEYGEIVVKEHHDTNFRVVHFIGRTACLESIESAEVKLGIVVWNKIFRRELIEGLRFPEGKRLLEDMTFVYAAADRASRVDYIDLSLYHYRYSPAGITKSIGAAEYLDPIESIAALIEWSEREAPECSKQLIARYLFWNQKACEAMLKHYDPVIFRAVKGNINRYKSRIRELPLRIRVLVGAAGRSWLCYKCAGEMNALLKRAYRKGFTVKQ